MTDDPRSVPSNECVSEERLVALIRYGAPAGLAPHDFGRIVRELQASRAAIQRLRAFLQLWKYEGHLQSFEDRERFRKSAEALLSGDSSAPETSTRRESDWKCTHCGRVNDPTETHCVQCEWSRKYTIAGVLHERGCNNHPCICGAQGRVTDEVPTVHAGGKHEIHEGRRENCSKCSAEEPPCQPGPIQSAPQDYTVQCRCGWMGKVSTLKSLPEFKMGCPHCSAEFVPIDRMTFPVNGSAD